MLSSIGIYNKGRLNIVSPLASAMGSMAVVLCVGYAFIGTLIQSPILRNPELVQLFHLSPPDEADRYQQAKIPVTSNNATIIYKNISAIQLARQKQKHTEKNRIARSSHKVKQGYGKADIKSPKTVPVQKNPPSASTAIAKKTPAIDSLGLVAYAATNPSEIIPVQPTTIEQLNIVKPSKLNRKKIISSLGDNEKTFENLPRKRNDQSAKLIGSGIQEYRIRDKSRNPHWWSKKRLPKSVISRKQQNCLATAIYFEARSEKLMGQAAVAEVVLNRVRNPAYPNTVCAVVYQNHFMHNACQFSFACDGIRERITDIRSWRQARKIALDVTTGKLRVKGIASSTHYHAVYVKPNWASSMKRQRRIGRHIFYKTHFGGWS